MNEIDFERLQSALVQPTHRPSPGGRLRLAPEPVPFVAPTLLCGHSETPDLFATEVVLIEASAAVGKSTMAQYLSASRSIPLLDLSTVPVSTGSLKALVSDLAGDADPIKAFHEGRLPIIIDALDEGRLLSSETGFDSFLETTVEFLLQDRTRTSQPKIIIFGRHDSVSNAATWLELVGESVTTRSIEVGFFREDKARDLIDRYATAAASADSAYIRHKDPATELINAYFEAIEAALGLQKGELWSKEEGRAFAGYAPVLAALGSLLAKMENFKEVTNRLRSEGRREAWSVIETVLDEIMARERTKLCEKLAQLIKSPVPDAAYDAHDQLAFLARLVHNQPVGTSSRVNLPSNELLQYHTMVMQYLGDHPFVKLGRPTNAVLGSLILAHAVVHDLLKGCDTQLLADLSRQPFLWRSLRSKVETGRDLLLDGRYVGWMLNSYWNDPITKKRPLVARSKEADFASVHIPVNGAKILELKVTLPLNFYGQIRDCDVDVEGSVRLQGHAAGGRPSTFYVRGRNILLANQVDVAADNVIIDEDLWLEATTIAPSPRLKIHVGKESRVGWGGTVGTTYPWNGIPATLQPPYVATQQDLVSALIAECSLRLPDRVLVVRDDYTFSEAENQWVARNFGDAFPKLLKLLCKHGLARAEGFGTYAQNKFRIHMNLQWTKLHEAFERPPEDEHLAAFVEEARQSIA